MDGDEGCGRAEFDEEVAVGDGIHGVLRDPGFALGIGETEQRGHELPIERQSAPGNGSGSQRANIQAPEGVGQAAGVAVEHLDIGEAMVSKEDRLGALEMRVAGNDHLGMTCTQLHQGSLERSQFAQEFFDLVTQPQAHVESDLIVPGTRRVQLGCSRHACGQFGLDVHVDVLQFLLPLELPRFDLHSNGLEAGDDVFALFGGEHSDLLQHGCMSHRADQVMRPQSPIEGDRLGELGDLLAGAIREAAGTGDDVGGRRARFLHVRRWD